MVQAQKVRCKCSRCLEIKTLYSVASKFHAGSFFFVCPLQTRQLVAFCLQREPLTKELSPLYVREARRVEARNEFGLAAAKLTAQVLKGVPSVKPRRAL